MAKFNKLVNTSSPLIWMVTVGVLSETGGAEGPPKRQHVGSTRGMRFQMTS
jgi:hypothetical protein